MTDAALVWTVAAAVVAAIVVPYTISFRRQQQRDRARKQEASALGVDRPTAQFPYIDPLRCIGCGACVAACPEGDVLAGPAGTPRPIVDRLNFEIVKIVKLPEVREKLAPIGIEPLGSSPDEMEAHIRADIEKWGRVARAGKISVGSPF